MPVSKTRLANTKTGRSSEAKTGEVWDKKSGPDENDGRANLQAGDKGKEPGGRWGPAYYESGPKIIGAEVIRKVGQDE